MTKICIARLRSGINYTEPLNHIVDSFCEMLRMFKERHPEHEYHYYNFRFGGKRPKRDLEELEASDVIIVPSEAEFTYHVRGIVHGLDVIKSNENVAKAEPFFAGKKLINLRSDRRDNEELYRLTFPNIDFDYDEIDEVDFDGNIHCLKYHFIKDKQKLFDQDYEKIYDFVYWGTDKRKTLGNVDSGDMRHKILKALHKSDKVQGMFIGKYYGFKRDVPFSKLKDILTLLNGGNTTICFNWMDQEATTSRYSESIACGIIPLVWQDYDSTGQFVKEEWQRVNNIDEALDKINYLRYNRQNDWEEVEGNFLKDLKSVEEYYQSFEKSLLEKL
jgi:hypothetical protein